MDHDDAQMLSDQSEQEKNQLLLEAVGRAHSLIDQIDEKHVPAVALDKHPLPWYSRKKKEGVLAAGGVTSQFVSMMYV